MSKHILRPLIAITAFVLCSGLTYIYVKKINENGKMVQLYREGLKVAHTKDNPFCPEAEIEYYDSLAQAPATNEMRTMLIQYYKSISLLKLGEEKKAVDLLQTVLNEAQINHQDRIAMAVMNSLSLAYLRLGERNNCINQHGSGSCIFPIQGKGVYMDLSASEKGIALYQQLLRLNPNDLTNRWLLNLAYMTIGQYPQKVPTEWLIPGLDTDTSSIKVNAFQDMAGSLKLNTTKNMAGGVIVDDFNKDGYLDIVTSTWGLEDAMHFYKNNGDRTFTDISKTSGLGNIKGGLNIIQTDYNNDGFTDILVLRGAWLQEFGKQPCTLLRNNGDGTFTDVTVSSGLLSFGPTQTATWADFNNDGYLDVFIGKETNDPLHPHPADLFINNQDGTFTNVAGLAGVDLQGFMKGCASADYNNDGWPDIFISGRDGHKILLKNKGIKGRIPQFEDVTHAAGLDKDTTYTFPTWFFDYDNDGWPDIFVCGYQFAGSLASTAAAEALNAPMGNPSKMYLYHNNHDGTFTNVSKEMGLDRPVFAMGSNFGDIDNDGWLDMYLGTGNPDFTSLVPNRLFKNIDGKKFVDVTSSARVGNLQKGHGVSFADINNDGNQDIFIETGGAYKGDAYYNSLYMNPGQEGHNNWIAISLEGVHCNRAAIGAHIILSVTDNGVKRNIYRDENSGGSFGGSPLRKEIGIGTATVIDELTIKWPTTGTVQVFKNVEPCQFIKIKEGSDRIEKQNIKALQFKEQMTMSCSK